jgi:uncharacterized protein
MEVSRRTVLRSFVAGAVAGVAGSAYADRSAYYPILERRELHLPRWDADGFRIAVLGDTHANQPLQMDRARRAARMAMAEKPDVIVMVGDFVDTSRFYALDHIRWAFEDLADATCPCLAVLGNHDYWVEHPERVIAAIDETPLTLLRNETFDVGGVSIAGVDDALNNRHDLTFFPPDKVSKSTIALLHEPDFVDEMPEHVSLQISGHSHGGQLCLPFGVPLHLPRGARRYYRGFYPDAPAPLYVTRGIGTIGVDWRTFAAPEVSLLTLRSAAA